jgi:hypothetical protein
MRAMATNYETIHNFANTRNFVDSTVTSSSIGAAGAAA